MENIHAGHRQRLRERFIKEGLENFEDHNCLELLLFYSLPRKDTNILAHRLIDHFGSLSAVFSANVSQLCQVEGISENSAVLISMIPQIMRKFKADPIKSVSMESTKLACEYCKNLYIGETQEKLRIFGLNDKLEMISNDVVAMGTTRNISLETRKIVEIALKNKTDLLMICHNHPNGSELPSDSDISATRRIKTTLRDINIELLDHIIVGSERAVSMKSMGYLTDF